MSRSSHIIQESLANTKLSARQQCVYKGDKRRNLRQINARKLMLKNTVSRLQLTCTTLSLTIRVCLHSFSCCCLPNLYEISRREILRKFKHMRSITDKPMINLDDVMSYARYSIMTAAGHPRSSVLVPIESMQVSSLDICYRFRYIDV